VDGRPTPPEPYWQPPGIVYALAAVFKVAGPGLLAPRLVLALLSTGLVLLVFALGRRLFSERVGLWAALLSATHGVLVFAAGELLPATFIAFFELLALHLLFIARERGSWRWAAGAGLAIGVAVVFAPTMLVFLPLAALALAGRGRAPLVAALIVASALPIAPVTARNLRVSSERVLVSTNGGINFYIGNNPSYRETFTLRPGRHWMELTSEPDRAGFAQPGSRSRYFYGKGLAFVREQPGRALALFLRKLYLVFHGAEIPRDTDIYDARARSPVIAGLVWPGPLFFPSVLLMPLALVGLWAAFAERRRVWPLLALFGSQALVMAAFFVSSRHRVPLLPLACLVAVFT